MFKRMANGWNLAKECWKVLMLDKELMVFPLISMIACGLILASFVAPLVASGLLDPDAGTTEISEPVMMMCFFAFYVITYFVMIFCNAALIACAMIRFRGGDPTVMDGLRAAGARTGKILAWSLVSAVIGMILQAIEQRAGAVGKIVAGLLGAAWAIASYFAVPVLVMENVGPVDALKRSASVMKKTWGETLAAEFGMFLLVLAASIPAVLLMVLGAGALGASSTIGGVLIVLGVIWLLTAILAGATLDAILKAALYLYASEGKVPHNFDDRYARAAFASR